MRRRLAWLAIPIGVGVASLAFLGSGGSHDERTSTATREEFRLTVEATGRLEAALAYDVGPPSVRDVWNYNLKWMVPDGSNVDLCRRAMIEGGERVVTPGSEGAELVGELKPKPGVRMDHKILLSGQFQELGPNESIMYKSRWGAFYRTPLEAYLRRRNINTVIVTGCNFPNCPRTSIYEASERDFRVVLVHDAVSQLYERDRSEMEDIGACLLSAQELEKLVDQHQA